MIDFITEKFTDITSKCLDRNAKDNNTTKQKMQLVFKLGDVEEVEYLIYKEYQPLKVVSFLDVLGVKLDFKGYSLFVPKFIKGALDRFCKEHDISRQNVRVVLSFNDKNDLIMWLYDSNKYIKAITLESLFDGDDLMME